jgi:hypothetical protein
MAQYGQNQQWDRPSQQYDPNQQQQYGGQQYDQGQPYDQNNQQYGGQTAQYDQQQQQYNNNQYAADTQQPQQQQQQYTNAYASSTTTTTTAVTTTPAKTKRQKAKEAADRNLTEMDAKTSFDCKIFLTVRGILRPIEFFCALIAWAPVITSRNYDLFDSFQFLCAMMMMVWFYCIFINLVYIFRWKVDRMGCAEYLPMIELTGDGMSMCAAFTAGCVAAHRCQQELGNGNTDRTCKDQNDWAAGAAFALITSFLFVASTVLSFKENKNLDNKVIV